MQPTPDDFIEGFNCSVSPLTAEQIVKLISDKTFESREECERLFPSGGYGVAQGVIRWQLINDACQSELLAGGFVGESRNYEDGDLLDGDEHINNFTLLISGEVGLLIFKASSEKPLPSRSKVLKYFSKLPFPMEPLWPELMRYSKNLPSRLKALYVIRYWLDEDDKTHATIGDIDVIVLSHNCKTIFCDVCDLRAYVYSGGDAPFIYGQELPIALRDNDRAPFGLPDAPTGADEDLPIDFSRKPDETE